MKIKFLKDFMAAQSDDYSDLHALFIERGDIVDVDGCKYNDSYFDMPKEQAQWLIDNGFAEEVKESGWWKPKNGEEYYAVSSHGVVGKATFAPENKLDREAIRMGNCFKTQEATERWRDYLKASATVRQDEGVLTPEQVNELIKNEDLAYYVGYMGNRGKGEVLCGCTMSFEDCWMPVGAILFDSEVHADRSLDKHPDEWKIIANYDWSRE